MPLPGAPCGSNPANLVSPSHLLSSEHHDRFEPVFGNSGRRHPPLPCFYPHSEWAALGPVQFGVRFQAQVHHRGDEPGLLGCCYLIDDLQRPAGYRSHPNKAVDVVVAKPSDSLGFRTTCSCLVSTAIKTDLFVRSFSMLIALFYAATSAVSSLRCSGAEAHRPRRLPKARCSKTANFRATATAARFLAFFPPRSHSRIPNRRKSVSGPNGPRM